MTPNSHAFIVVLRFRNKREDTSPRVAVLAQSEMSDALPMHAPGMLGLKFVREASSVEDAVRLACDQALDVLTDATLIEVHAPALSRMAVRRGMMGYRMPWRFYDQGMPDLRDGLMAEEARKAIGAA